MININKNKFIRQKRNFDNKTKGNTDFVCEIPQRAFLLALKLEML